MYIPVVGEDLQKFRRCYKKIEVHVTIPDAGIPFLSGNTLMWMDEHVWSPYSVLVIDRYV